MFAVSSRMRVCRRSYAGPRAAFGRGTRPVQDPEAVVPAAEVAEASSRLWSAEEVDDDADYLTMMMMAEV